jgi:glutamate synthase (ferredoxin)
MQRVNAPAGQMQLKGLIEAYVVSELLSFMKNKCCKLRIKCCQHLILLIFYILKEKTGSEKGAAILREWEAYLPLFWQLVPPSEEDSPEACAEFERVLAKQATTQLSAK